MSVPMLQGGGSKVYLLDAYNANDVGAGSNHVTKLD